MHLRRFPVTALGAIAGLWRCVVALPGGFDATAPRAASQCSAIQPAPAQLHCGSRGQFKLHGRFASAPYAATYTEPFLATGLNDCRDACLTRRTLSNTATTGCQQFDFNETSSICRLHSNNGKTKPIPFTANPSSDVVAYDQGCFDCPFVCPIALGTDLLRNGGFEDGGLGPWDDYAATGRPTFNITPEGSLVSPGYKSATAYHASTFKGDISQWVSVCDDDQLYSVSLYFKFKNITNQPDLKFSIGDWEYVVDPATLAPTGWTYFESSFTSGIESQSFPFVTLAFEATFNFFAKKGTRDFTMDQASIVPLQTPTTAKPGSVEIVKNGDLESGSIKPWVATSSPPDQIVSPGLESSNYAFAVRGDNDGFSQIINLTPGTRYRLSFDYQAVPDADSQLGFAIFYLDCDGNDWTFNTNQATTVTVERTWVANSAQPMLGFYVYSTGENRHPDGSYDDGFVYFDNISVKEAA